MKKIVSPFLRGSMAELKQTPEPQEPVENEPEIESKQSSPPTAQAIKLSTDELASLPPATPASFTTPQIATHRKGDRHDKSKVTVTFRISLETDEVITKTSAECKLSKQAFLELAIHHFADRLTSKQTQEGAVLLAHDDRRIDFWKTNEIIISTYEALTANNWKPNDDREGQRFNGKDPRCVEIGMLNTLLRSKARKINSFAYFVPEIEEMYAIPLEMETLNIMLRRRREQWKAMKSQSR